MWTYQELKFIFINQLRLSSQELALEVNREFHGGGEVMNSADIEKIKSNRTIFGGSRMY